MHIDQQTFNIIKGNAVERARKANEAARAQDKLDSRKDWIALALCLLAVGLFSSALFLAVAEASQVDQPVHLIP